MGDTHRRRDEGGRRASAMEPPLRPDRSRETASVCVCVCEKCVYAWVCEHTEPRVGKVYHPVHLSIYTEYFSMGIPSVFLQEWETFSGVVWCVGASKCRRDCMCARTARVHTHMCNNSRLMSGTLCHYILMSCGLEWKGSNYTSNWTGCIKVSEHLQSWSPNVSTRIVNYRKLATSDKHMYL